MPRVRRESPGANVRQSGDAARSAEPNREQIRSAGTVDAFTPTESQRGRYAALARLGRFDGFVTLPDGREIHVRIRPGKSPATTPPLVYLDGLNGAAERARPLESLVENDGHTLIAIALLGQGETLLRDLEKTKGASMARDISPDEQVRAVLQVLDALGVQGPVNMMGLSYGAGIAALVKREAPSRVAKLLLAAPYTISMSFHDPVRATWHALLNNPWNPLGEVAYRTVTRTLLGLGTLPPRPFDEFHEQQAFREAIYRLTMGMEKFDLGQVVRGLDEVHFLAVPLDPISPPPLGFAAYRQVASGSYSEAAFPWSAAMHDLIDWNPDVLVKWASDTLKRPPAGPPRP